ncbi:HEPN domain-containing protein [Singulisphaera sp. PoT]|uniref:HEPN domain-containing protein n=1 Tax=Singulisphaera sp. PoT TaxID=3411797 RepID=UPI003BF4C356
MAIINTLQKCLESPYLFKDEAAPARIPTLLTKAADRLEAAANLVKGGQKESADVAFLCYESMFSCLRALVYQRGYREAGFRCLLLACEAFYVREGMLEAEHVHAIEKVQALKTTPDESLMLASAFIRKTLEILGE